MWTIRHLATCYRQMRRYEDALEYYRKAEAIQPDNRNILFYTGSCLAELERYDEALQYFFRLDLMENDRDVKAWRAIAWCSFACGKQEQAARYYGKVLDSGSPLATDYLNAGHVAWAGGNMAQAAGLYNRAAQACGSRDEFFNCLKKTRTSLSGWVSGQKTSP